MYKNVIHSLILLAPKGLRFFQQPNTKCTHTFTTVVEKPTLVNPCPAEPGYILPLQTV